MKIIGITGTLGAGKGTIVDYLVKNHGYCHFSVRGFLKEQIEQRGEIVNRDSLTYTANVLRAQFGPSYIAEQLWQQAQISGRNCIIESIRTLGEVQALKAKGNFTLFSVDTDRLLRYQRVLLRGSETDHISFETFSNNEDRELQSADPNRQNLTGCMALADFHFLNNGSFQDLFHQIDLIIHTF